MLAIATTRVEPRTSPGQLEELRSSPGQLEDESLSLMGLFAVVTVYPVECAPEVFVNCNPPFYSVLEDIDPPKPL